MTHPTTAGRLLAQTEVWVNAEGVHRLDDMDPHHRANLIPYLRGNARTFLMLADPIGYVVARHTHRLEQAAQDWMAEQPLMRRLCELEAGRPIEDRRETAQRNQIYEQATGYQKVRLG